MDTEEYKNVHNSFRKGPTDQTRFTVTFHLLQHFTAKTVRHLINKNYIICILININHLSSYNFIWRSMVYKQHKRPCNG
jgi:hypothetical protein